MVSVRTRIRSETIRPFLPDIRIIINRKIQIKTLKKARRRPPHAVASRRRVPAVAVARRTPDPLVAVRRTPSPRAAEPPPSSSPHDVGSRGSRAANPGSGRPEAGVAVRRTHTTSPRAGRRRDPAAPTAARPVTLVAASRKSSPRAAEQPPSPSALRGTAPDVAVAIRRTRPSPRRRRRRRRPPHAGPAPVVASRGSREPGRKGGG
uniref:Uncharacterized protein n=1 Tax=Oryza sativa subsp. japonica TaxID=39947 RepID=Q8W2P8_ORYSJ|nr:Unknown protein [Oryza sativa]AAL76186.1 Unknown protein [Oryza sativa]